LANPNIAELGRPYQFKPGQSGNARGRPVLDPVEKLLREAEREKRLAAQWVADLEDADPAVRLPVRKDLMDRINGKAPQSINIFVEPPDPEANLEGVEAWSGF